MLRHSINPLGQKSNLHVCRSAIMLGLLISLNQLCFSFFANSHQSTTKLKVTAFRSDDPASVIRNSYFKGRDLTRSLSFCNAKIARSWPLENRELYWITNGVNFLDFGRLRNKD